MANILEHLPPVITDIREIQCLAVAENAEFNALYRALADLMNDQFVETATENGIKRWERMLQIVPTSTATLEERRFEILNRLNVKLPYTMKMLKNRLKSLYGDAYTLKFINDTMTLKIGIPNEQTLASTTNMLNVICPANVYIEIEVI